MKRKTPPSPFSWAAAVSYPSPGQGLDTSFPTAHPQTGDTIASPSTPVVSELDKQISYCDLLFTMTQLGWRTPSTLQDCETYVSLLEQRGTPGDLQKMVEAYDQLKALVPPAGSLWMAYDEKQFLLLTDHLHQWDEALRRSEQLLAVFPHYTMPYFSRKTILRHIVNTCRSQGEVASYHEGANHYFSAYTSPILQRFPQLLLKKEYGAILSESALLLPLTPPILEAHIYHCTALVLSGIHDPHILESVKNIFGAQPSANAFQKIAHHLEMAGRYQEALRIYDQAIAVCPARGDLYKQKATLLRFLGNSTESIRNYYYSFTANALGQSVQEGHLPRSQHMDAPFPASLGQQNLSLRPTKTDRLLAATGVKDIRFSPNIRPLYTHLLKHYHPGIRAVMQYAALERYLTVLVAPLYDSCTLGEYHRDHNIVSFKLIEDTILHEFCHLVNAHTGLTQTLAKEVAETRRKDAQRLQGKPLSPIQQAIVNEVIHTPLQAYPTFKINEETIVRIGQVIVRYGYGEVAKVLPHLYGFFTNTYTPEVVKETEKKHNVTLYHAVSSLVEKVLQGEPSIIIIGNKQWDTTASEGLRQAIQQKFMGDAMSDKKLGTLLVRNYVMRNEKTFDDLASLMKQHLYQHRVLSPIGETTYAIPRNINAMPQLSAHDCHASWQDRVQQPTHQAGFSQGRVF